VDLLSNVAMLLRSDFAQEAATGFPRLARIPCTSVIKFLDYFEAQAPADRQPLLDVLARFSAMKFFPPQLISRQYQELRTSNPAYVRFWAAMQSERFAHGYRYEGVKMTRMMVRDVETVAAITKVRAGLDWQPRDDPPAALVPDPDLTHLNPAKAPLLRKLVKQAFTRLFAAEAKKLPGGETGYTGTIDGTKLTVWVDFGSMSAQLRYGVSIPDEQRRIFVSRLSYDDLWITNLGWDYLTEENAAPSIELLCEQISYLAGLTHRIAELALNG
jgi:hypothetical protein